MSSDAEALLRRYLEPTRRRRPRPSPEEQAAVKELIAGKVEQARDAIERFLDGIPEAD